MSTLEEFGFEKLNRVPKKIIQDAVAEFRKKNPGQALNRMALCQIVAENLEQKYLKAEEIEDCNDVNKKNYNGEHILKKMGLQRTEQISRKIDFYVYRFYTKKNIEN